MKRLRRIYFKLFPTYKEIEVKCFTWAQADDLMKSEIGKPAKERWAISKEEDNNPTFDMVYLCRKERITE